VVDDLVDFADGMHLDRFAVAGFSGGGGFALAVAARLPHRVTTVIVGGGMGALASAPRGALPVLARMLFATAPLRPRLARVLVAAPMRLAARRFARDLDHPRKGAASMLRGAANGAQLAAVDAYVAMRSDEALRAELSDRIRSFRSLAGVVTDLRMYGGAWPVDLAALTMPVEIWHGRSDPAVPIAFAEALARTVAQPRLHLCDGEGHFVFHSHGVEVMGRGRRLVSGSRTLKDIPVDVICCPF
jgi:pimeloyl-ACP methyl ester carboxylesterase